MTFSDRANKHRTGGGLFWLILGVIFIFGGILPHWFTGLLVLMMVGIDGAGRVSRGHYHESTKAEQAEHARRLGDRIFLPVLMIPLVTVVFAFSFRLLGLDVNRGALVGLGFGGVSPWPTCCWLPHYKFPRMIIQARTLT